MSECKQCPNTVGDSYKRDCAFPDCVGGWEEAYKSIQVDNTALREALAYYSVPENFRDLKSIEKDANRYRYLRDRDLDTINNGGVFAGITPDNFILNGDDLDEVVDLALTGSKPIQGIKTQ